MSQSTSDQLSWSMVRQVLARSYLSINESLQKLLNSEMTVDQDVDQQWIACQQRC